jgi:hypothetical protein
MDATERKRIEDTKAEIIRELDKYEKFGTNLSFKPRQDMDEDKLRHELERHIANDTIVQRVTVMKIIIQFGTMGLEFFFTKMKFLRLEGWSSYLAIQLNTGKYDATLEQAYRTIWKRGAPNPWFLLVGSILGTALLFHFQVLTLEQAKAAAAAGGGGNGGGGGGGGGIFNSILGGLLGGIMGGGNKGGGGGGGGGGGIMGIFNNIVDSQKPERGRPHDSGPPRAAQGASGHGHTHTHTHTHGAPSHGVHIPYQGPQTSHGPPSQPVPPPPPSSAHGHYPSQTLGPKTPLSAPDGPPPVVSRRRRMTGPDE